MCVGGGGGGGGGSGKYSRMLDSLLFVKLQNTLALIFHCNQSTCKHCCPSKFTWRRMVELELRLHSLFSGEATCTTP